VVMVMRGMVSSKFKVGAGVSVAAGPVGREISARTNYTRTNYKCSMKFLPFAIMRHFRRRRLSGAVIEQDRDENNVLYGKTVPFAETLNGKVAAPSGSKVFEAAVEKYYVQARQREVTSS
jgi:lipid-binding SYLF domain-containing protein